MGRLGGLLLVLLVAALTSAPAGAQNVVEAYGTVSVWGGDPCDPPIAQAWASSTHRATVTTLYRLDRGERVYVTGELKRHTDGCTGYAIRRGTCQGSRRITSPGQSVTCHVPSLNTACEKGHRAWTQSSFTNAIPDAHFSPCASVSCESCTGCE